MWQYISDRKFLRIVVNKSHCQFAVLSFGLSTAQCVFTKCMAIVVAFLRKSRIQMFPFLTTDW